MLPMADVWLLTLILELTCLEDVRKLRSTPTGRQLHNSAWVTSIFNHFVYGGLTYYISVAYFCSPMGVLTILERIQAALGVLIIQGLDICGEDSLGTSP